MKENLDNPITNRNPEAFSYEEARALAGNLLEKYGRDMVISSQDEKSNPNIYEENSAIKYFLDKVPKEITSRYFGHGVTRNDKLDKLTSIILICSAGKVKGWEGPLTIDPEKHQNMKKGERFHQQSAFTKGAAALVISQKDKNIFGGGIDKKDNIGVIVLNSAYYPLYDELKSRFPNVNLIKAENMAGYLK